MKYLNEAGVTKLWQKISSVFAKKTDLDTLSSDIETLDRSVVQFGWKMEAVQGDLVYHNEAIGSLENLSTSEQSNLVGAINEVNAKNETKVVYDMTLTEATNVIEVTGLDMVRDGGEYEFEFYHKEDASGDLHITFNGIASDYYMAGSYLSGSLTANGSPTMAYFYRQSMTRIYYGTGGGSDGNINFPATMKGRFYFVNNTRKTIAFELKNHLVVYGIQTIVDQYGVNGKQVDNLTSIRFGKDNNGKFVAGTRLIIRKK